MQARTPSATELHFRTLEALFRALKAQAPDARLLAPLLSSSSSSSSLAYSTSPRFHNTSLTAAAEAEAASDTQQQGAQPWRSKYDETVALPYQAEVDLVYTDSYGRRVGVILTTLGSSRRTPGEQAAMQHALKLAAGWRTEAVEAAKDAVEKPPTRRRRRTSPTVERQVSLLATAATAAMAPAATAATEEPTQSVGEVVAAESAPVPPPARRRRRKSAQSQDGAAMAAAADAVAPAAPLEAESATAVVVAAAAIASAAIGLLQGVAAVASASAAVSQSLSRAAPPPPLATATTDSPWHDCDAVEKAAVSSVAAIESRMSSSSLPRAGEAATAAAPTAAIGRQDPNADKRLDLRSDLGQQLDEILCLELEHDWFHLRERYYSIACKRGQWMCAEDKEDVLQAIGSAMSYLDLPWEAQLDMLWQELADAGAPPPIRVFACA
ncbi:hypothetical protein Agub_g2443 [Astrephomene gubernaculifera]|uniref:Uncharacterized protein n=1 Tax=Astrephomene gubernaculifera TaxID=47775 RepID=A0AAD3DH24_9CHLO|nr:hypothetical protein Agub_g2443 [Astrephomene gubernaculifera]